MARPANTISTLGKSDPNTMTLDALCAFSSTLNIYAKYCEVIYDARKLESEEDSAAHIKYAEAFKLARGLPRSWV